MRILLAFLFFALVTSAVAGQEPTFSYSNQRYVGNKYGGSDVVDVAMEVSYQEKQYHIYLGISNVENEGSILTTNQWCPNLVNFGDINEDGRPDLWVTVKVNSLGSEEVFRLYTLTGSGFQIAAGIPVRTEAWGGGDTFFLKSLMLTRSAKSNFKDELRTYITWDTEKAPPDPVPVTAKWNDRYFFYAGGKERYFVVQKDGINLLSDRNTNSRTISLLKKDDTLLLVSYSDVSERIEGEDVWWLYVKDILGNAGWIKGDKVHDSTEIEAMKKSERLAQPLIGHWRVSGVVNDYETVGGGIYSKVERPREISEMVFSPNNTGYITQGTARSAIVWKNVEEAEDGQSIVEVSIGGSKSLFKFLPLRKGLLLLSQNTGNSATTYILVDHWNGDFFPNAF